MLLKPGRSPCKSDLLKENSVVFRCVISTTIDDRGASCEIQIGPLPSGGWYRIMVFFFPGGFYLWLFGSHARFMLFPTLFL